MKILIPGSFDPPTNGHIDVINRCSDIFYTIVHMIPEIFFHLYDKWQKETYSTAYYMVCVTIGQFVFFSIQGISCSIKLVINFLNFRWRENFKSRAFNGFDAPVSTLKHFIFF